MKKVRLLSVSLVCSLSHRVGNQTVLLLALHRREGGNAMRRIALVLSCVCRMATFPGPAFGRIPSFSAVPWRARASRPEPRGLKCNFLSFQPKEGKAGSRREWTNGIFLCHCGKSSSRERLRRLFPFPPSALQCPKIVHFRKRIDRMNRMNRIWKWNLQISHVPKLLTR